MYVCRAVGRCVRASQRIFAWWGVIVEVTLRLLPALAQILGLCCRRRSFKRKMREDPRKHSRHRHSTPMRVSHVFWARLHGCFVSHQLHTSVVVFHVLYSLHVNYPHERLMPCLDSTQCLLGSHITYHSNKNIAHRSSLIAHAVE